MFLACLQTEEIISSFCNCKICFTGLGGSPQVVEIGGAPFLLPLVQRDKVYDLGSLPEVVGYDPAFVVGAGAGPWPYIGVNCEVCMNTNLF